MNGSTDYAAASHDVFYKPMKFSLGVNFRNKISVKILFEKKTKPLSKKWDFSIYWKSVKFVLGDVFPKKKKIQNTWMLWKLDHNEHLYRYIWAKNTHRGR